MFSLLDMLNHFVSSLNFNTKHKNRLYLILAFFSTAYIGYLSWEFFKYAAVKRGLLYLLIFLCLSYFCLVNFLYFFTNKTVKWDISRFFARFIVEHEAEHEKKNDQQVGKTVQMLPSGTIANQLILYDQLLKTEQQGQELSGKAAISPTGKIALDQMMQFITDQQILAAVPPKQIQTEKKYTIGAGVWVPSFSLNNQGDAVVLAIGFNAMERVEVGTITHLGGMAIKKISASYTFSPLSVKIIGGPYFMKGRATVKTQKDPYQLIVTVACTPKR